VAARAEGEEGGCGVTVPADRQAREATDRARETLEWIGNWRDGQFAPARTQDGWTVEMYGLADSAAELATDVLTLAAALAEAERERAGLIREIRLVLRPEAAEFAIARALAVVRVPPEDEA
jgi:hypothetical protein